MGIFKRKFKIGLFALLALLIAGFLYFYGTHVILAEYLTREAQSELKFTFSSCSGDEGKAFQKVLNKKWEKDTFIVEGAITPNCGTTWIFGSYSINPNNQLDLEYKPIISGLMACMCSHKVKYEISGLKKQEYTINFIQLPEKVVGY